MEKKESKPRKNKTIPKKIRELVWNKYIGIDIGRTACFCCKTTEISQMNFHCGHIISEYNNGPTTIDNLIPICALCNTSMGKNNLYDFMDKYKLHDISNNLENQVKYKLEKPEDEETLWKNFLNKF
jgi:hypothetical protein